MSLPTITSLQNPRVKDAVKLRERRGREKQGRILIEGIREIRQALNAGVEIAEVFVCESLCATTEAAELAVRLGSLENVRLLPVSEQVMLKLAFGDRSEGMLAIAQPPQRGLDELVSPKDASALYAVVEGIEKPGNLGAMIRTADAAGVGGVIVADGGTDLFNPNAIRASLGAIFTVPVCAASSEETLRWIRKQGLHIFAAKVDGSVPYSEADFRSPCAVVLGSEAHGLSPLWNGKDVTAISIPLLGGVDSLNLSASAAILFYEALRQRQERVPNARLRG
jgi:TrmH family RNA methyltransferase